MRWLLVLLLVLPALEIGVFIWAGGIIGAWWVVALIIFTGVAGLAIAKKQGLDTWNRAQYSMGRGQAPTEEILDGICIFIGAVFLFSPGFITDIAGFSLVLPATRGPFKKLLQQFFKNKRNKGNVIYWK